MRDAIASRSQIGEQHVRVFFLQLPMESHRRAVDRHGRRAFRDRRRLSTARQHRLRRLPRGGYRGVVSDRSVVGQRLERLAGDAKTRGWAFSAGEYYLRATNYYLVAERMMSWTDPRRLASYRRALAAFEDGYRLSGHRAERIEVTNQEGAPLAAYLRLPPGEGPFPALIFSNGFDSIKEMHYLLYADDAVKRGDAVLLIDQEGTGQAMRFHDIKKRVDAEMSVAPFLDYLAIRYEIDSDRIGVAGISNGGYDAPRAAAFDERLKCVACLGAFYNAEDYLGRFSGGGADKVVHGLSDLDDQMMKVMGANEVEIGQAVDALARTPATE